MAEKVAKKPNFFVRMGRGIARFFRDTKGEMKKVVWPSKKQVINNLFVVAAFVIIIAIIMFVLDFLFNAGIMGALNLAGGKGFFASNSTEVAPVVASEVSSVTSEVSSTVSSVVSEVSSVVSSVA